MFDKIPENGNDVDSLVITFVENSGDTYEEMHNRSSLIVSSVLSVYDQLVINPDLSNNATNDEAISISNKVLYELPSYGHDQSSRKSGKHVCTTSLSLCTFVVHNDHSMNTSFLHEVVNDSKLLKVTTSVMYWNLASVGPENNACEFLDDWGLFSMDEMLFLQLVLPLSGMLELHYGVRNGCAFSTPTPTTR